MVVVAEVENENIKNNLWFDTSMVYMNMLNLQTNSRNPKL